MIPTIELFANNTVCISGATNVVYVDPYLVHEPCAKADLVFITHTHYDHLDPASLAAICTANTTLVGPRDVLAEVEQQADELGISPEHLVCAIPSEAGVAQGVAFEAVPAYNVQAAFHPRENGWVGYVLEVDGTRIYVAGDSDATPEAAAVVCDAAIVPVCGKYTMDAPTAAQLVNTIAPRIAIPSHYGTVHGSHDDATRFAALVNPAIDVQILRE